MRCSGGRSREARGHGVTDVIGAAATSVMAAAQLTLVALLALLCGVTSADSDTPEAIRRLEEEIRRDLPSGTSLSAVVSFLRTHNVAHHDSKDISYFNGPRTIWGLILQRTGLLVTDFVLTFEFDGQEKLASYSTRRQLVGP